MHVQVNPTMSLSKGGVQYPLEGQATHGVGHIEKWASVWVGSPNQENHLSKGTTSYVHKYLITCIMHSNSRSTPIGNYGFSCYGIDILDVYV